jgi:hypothetical protein
MKRIQEAKQNAHALLDENLAVNEENIHRILGLPTVSDVYVTDQLWDDTGLKPFLVNATTTKGGGEFLWQTVKHLTTNTNILKARQNPILPDNIRQNLKRLSELEKNVLWLFTVPEISKAWPLNILFPTAFGLRMINNFPYLIEGFHLYRCFAAPYMNIITPLSTLLAPWIYVRRNLKWMVSFKAYCKLLLTALSAAFRVTGNLRNDASRVISIVVYATLFVYTAVQAFETSSMLRKIRKSLKAKLEQITEFVTIAEQMIARTPIATLHAWGIEQLPQPVKIAKGITGLYKLLTDPNEKAKISELVKAVYALDVSAFVSKTISSRMCVPVQFTDKMTVIWNMGHILLGSSQVRNPIALQKNLIVTGPNAAGKTTYIRSLFTNMILSQSLGIACARTAYIKPVHAIGTFIRVSDTLGKLSLFEAETQRCTDIIKIAKCVSDRGQAGLFFLDEPMHSTPPLEGMSTCRAVIEHLADMPGIRTITTTHYIEVTKIAKDLPDKFENVCMTALIANDGGFKFPYQIHSGASAQCIALELLHDHQLPKEVIVRAIELKNKLYPRVVNDQARPI